MPYYVYVIELKKAFAKTQKAMEANPHARSDKPCIYVGQSSKIPEQRLYEHINGIRNKKGPLYSKVVHRYGKMGGLRPDLYEKCNPMSTREEAELKESELTQKYRRRGYTVWSN